MILRASPTKLIVQIFISQTFTLILLGVTNIIDHSTMFYNTFTHSQFVSFGVLSLVISLLVLFFSIAYSISVWLNNVYEVNDGKLIIKKGLLNKEILEIKLDNITQTESKIPFLGKFFNYGDILLKTDNSGKNIKLDSITDVLNTQKFLQSQKFIRKQAIKVTKESIHSIIKNGENDDIKFKSSLRWDLSLQKVNKALEKSILKTIVGFMNGNGGLLLIGVSDTGELLGINADYSSLPKKNIDGFENHITQLFGEYIGIEYRHLIRILHFVYENKEIVVVKIKPSKNPIYLKSGESEDFFLRTGNTTSLLSGHEIFNYLKYRNKI
jgi:hypothetical protein